MKNYFSKLLKGSLPVQIFSMLFLSLVLVSCEKEEVQDTGELTVFNMLASSKSKAAPAPGDATITAIAAGNDDFEILVEALTYYNLADFFNGKDQYTVFAPTDQAFQDLFSVAGVDNLTELIDAVGEETVLNVLLYHVTEGRRASNSVVPKRNYRTIETLLSVGGEAQTFKVDPQLGIWDNLNLERDIKITTADISASNGIIHIVNSVLIPLESL